jgi:large subunit ribosomal protein L4
MTTIDVRTPEGGTDGSVELPEAVFDVAANVPLIHQVVVAQLAAARQGTHDTKSRAGALLLVGLAATAAHLGA